ncbi:MAG: hypothetical protein H6832_18960 [Planctomycetes bacterium]|nr:hypothetical protein [Planctomycetota bacterium]MCB9920491.1 hypothetical protein [Planctomycetota bacterium]
MLNRSLLIACSLCITTLSLGAQVTPHARALPAALTGSYGGVLSTWDPTAQGNRVEQIWFRGDQIKTALVINESGLRAHGTNTSGAVTFTYGLVLDNSTAAWTAMDPDPKKNLTATAATVFNNTLNLPARGAGVDPNDVHMWVKHSRPFVFTGPHLILQHTFTPGAVSGLLRMNAGNSSSGSLMLTSGNTCGGTLSTTYSSGTYTMAVKGAQANAACLFMIGAEKVLFAGSVPLPVDLSGLGMTTCELGLEPVFSLPAVTDGTGAASISAPFTLKAADTDVWSIQAMHQTTSNSAGWATTNVMTSILGTVGLMRSLRVDNRGTNGPSTFNSVSIITLVR